ncbi:hypothetical protein PHYPSEUDO_006378 [Phytophthora pseudosyringae]|uniref:Uncharacterized protein n=1 Tax=Phytophthora pseudosyringae TaxID=221518 RepID=A0A8T1WEX9_9STRA|nr:hypothetical protein PHYPSEUDO_006378 [Phytophthora pseudosyringae]
MGIEWKIPDECITVPQRKLDKLRSVLTETLGKTFLSTKRPDSVIGVILHVISFIPTTKPFIQCVTVVQNLCRRLQSSDVPMMEFLRKDLEWWNALIFQTDFAGMPMNLFNHTKVFDEAWLFIVAKGTICITNMKLQDRLILKQHGQARDGNELAHALANVTDTWEPSRAPGATSSSTASDRSQNWSTR